MLKLKEHWSGGGTKSMFPGPQQCRLAVGFQQASPTSVFDLKLAIKLVKCQCDYYSGEGGDGFSRYAMQVLWFGWFFLHTYSSWVYPFPCAGIYSCKFSHSRAQRAAALPA